MDSPTESRPSVPLTAYGHFMRWYFEIGRTQLADAPPPPPPGRPSEPSDICWQRWLKLSRGQKQCFYNLAARDVIRYHKELERLGIIEEDTTNEQQNVGNAATADAGNSVLRIELLSSGEIKLQQRCERNRQEGMRCCKKKLDRIAELKEKAKQLRKENNELVNVFVELRDSVDDLKRQVDEIIQPGCEMVVGDQSPPPLVSTECRCARHNTDS